MIAETETWTLAEGEGKLKLSEKEATAHMMASIVIPNVSRAFALYPNECIFCNGNGGSKELGFSFSDLGKNRVDRKIQIGRSISDVEMEKLGLFI